MSALLAGLELLFRGTVPGTVSGALSRPLQLGLERCSAYYSGNSSGIDGLECLSFSESRSLSFSINS
jgi:hypothetical protein